MTTEVEGPSPARSCSWAELIRGWSALGELAPRRVLAIECADSTQTVARRIVADDLDRGEPAEDCVVLALAQTEGRGRQTRVWKSPAGRGVYASLITTPRDLRQLQRLPLLAGLALSRTLDAWLPESCRLKWPNDLLVGGRKIGGILVESVSRGDSVVAIVGFGINLAQGEAELPSAEATSLTLTASTVPDLPQLAGALVRGLCEELDAGRDAATMVEEFLVRSAHRVGDEISFHGEGGRCSGTFLGIEGDGRLRLEVEGEERLCLAGEVGEARGESLAGCRPSRGVAG